MNVTWRLGAGLAWTLLAAVPIRPQDAPDEALQLRRAGQFEAALVVVEARLAVAPQDERSLGLRGLLLLDLRRDEDASRLAVELAGYTGGEFRVHLFLGRSALGQAESEAAIAHLQRALECKPDAIEPASVLVQAQIAAGKLRAAIALAEQVEARSPELGRKLGAQAWVAQARRHRQRGEEVAAFAIDDFRKALEKQPGDLDIVRQLADTLIDLAYSDEARALIDEHFDSQVHPVDWHYLVGRCHAARLELPQAETELRAVLALEPQHASALIELSRLALDDGRPEQARVWLQTATEAEPRLSRAWMLLGEAHEALHDDIHAESAYRQACELQAANSKAQYLLGRLLLRTGRDAEGESLLHLAMADDPERLRR